MISPFVSGDMVQGLKEKIIGKYCRGLCKGSGTIFENFTFSDCSCIKEFQYQLDLTCANIPKKYWGFDYRNLLRKFTEDNSVSLSIIKNYSLKINEMIEGGIGLYIEGNAGLAKSSLGCYILKEALKNKQTVFCIRMSQLTKLLVENLLNNEVHVDHTQWIKDKVSLLMIDEIEKDYKINDTNSFSGSIVNDFFGAVYDSKKSLIVTSNKPKHLLKGIHAESVIDRLEELADVILIGSSFRGQNEAISQILK